MCGIYAYIGKKRNATSAVFDGLKRLEYRGYDSWGIAIVKNNKILLNKHVGKVNRNLLTLPKSNMAIGHTRWATHGAVTDLNAHPHFSSDKSFILAQNGIMENHERVKKNLFRKYYKFISQTDTEVIVRLIEEERKKTKDIVGAIRNAFNKLSGRNTIIVLTNDGKVIGVRNGSPLVLGFSKDKKEIYFSSDTLSFAPYIDQTFTLENGNMAIYDNGKIIIADALTGKNVDLKNEENVIHDQKYSKGKYKHFMIKEINEQPETVNQVIKQDRKLMQDLADQVKKSKNVYCIGSGTAGAAAAQIAYYLRTYGKINAISLIGAEADEYKKLITNRDIIIAPSQSGETADVLQFVEKLKEEKKVIFASYVNMQGSLMTRISDFKFMANAGPEICVMSTKVFVSQISWGYLLAKTVQGKYSEGIIKLKRLSKKIDRILNSNTEKVRLKKLAKILSKKKDVFILGKGQNLQIIKEGMVKMIEGSYIHAHGIAAGDLKHYAITLMEKGVPVIFVISNDNLRDDVINAMNEVKARGAEVYLIEDKEKSETSAISNIVHLQLLAYYTALFKGNDIDKPRNIAKSVTVK